MASRSLTVWCRGGLSNRLRVLVSGLAASEASGRTFRMIGPRPPARGAPSGELLVNDGPVLDVAAAWAGRVRRSDRGRRPVVLGAGLTAGATSGGS